MKKLKLGKMSVGRYVILSCLVFICSASTVMSAIKPSILFCTPQGTRTVYLDFNYVKELHAKGFEIDYLEGLDEFMKLSPERISKYNVLVIYLTPDAFRVCHQNQRTDEKLVKSFQNMINDYVSKGGGVLLIPDEGNSKKQHVAELTDLWGAKITSSRIEESNKDNISRLTNSSYHTPLQYTDNILTSPVSKGVKGIWYPSMQHYNGSATNALIIDKDWQAVVKGSKTSKARAFGTGKDYNYGANIKDISVSAEGIVSPVIFAIRNYKKGRIALVSMMPQFSLGSGTGFIFNREVLSKGVNGKKSDFGRLLENTFKWLAEPSMKNSAVGGYATRESALIIPNERKLVKESNEYTFWYWEYVVKQWHNPPLYGNLYKGLIGAHSAFSDGKGTVADYKKAAIEAGLDFLVFLEKFEDLTKKEYQELVKQCKELSDSKVKLIPGFTIKNNIGNHTMCIAEDGFWPEEKERVGPNKTLLNVQPQDKDGNFTGYNNGSSFGWHLDHCHKLRNIGYYNWADSEKGMRMPFQRNCAVAGIRYYKDGKLVEDMTDEYLTTLQSTMPPSPVSVNEVKSPEELIKEVKSGNALTYVTARNIHNIMQDGLRWSGTYDGMNVFLSDGPMIHAWPTCYRPMTFGGEEFVTTPAIMESELYVTSDVGLKEITIYNGREVFRRFRPNGAKEFRKKLVLNGTVMKHLIVIAEDVDGKKATSFARRCSKYDIRALSYCSDHFNDGPMRSFHGPGGLPVCQPPQLHWDIGGYTWDGGPPAVVPLISFCEGRPHLQSDKGTESGRNFNQYPITEASDECLVATASVQDELFDEKVKRIVNAWHTFGPHGEKSKLMKYILRYKELYPPSDGVPISDLPIRSLRSGIRVNVFTQEITFKEDMKIKRLWLVTNGSHKPKATPTFLIVGRNKDKLEKVIDVEKLKKVEEFLLKKGDWFAAFCPNTSCTQMFILNSPSVVLRVGNYNQSPNWINLYADLAGKEVKKGEKYELELVSLNSSIDLPIPTVEKVQRYYAFLNNPDNMKILRGKRQDTPGYLEIESDNGAVEVVIPKPKDSLNITLPLRIPGLNRKWSAGMWQKEGYIKGYYSDGKNVYRGLGIDMKGNALFPLYIGKTDNTHVLAGHPIIADERGKDVAINVMHVFDNPHQWHIAVNNTSDREITTKLKQAMDLPLLEFEEREIILQPGEHRVLKAKVQTPVAAKSSWWEALIP